MYFAGLCGRARRKYRNGGNCGNAEPDSAKTETSEKTEEPAKQDGETKELVQEYTGWLKENKARAVTGTYSSELKKFPADYQKLLATLHKAHPNWVFIAEKYRAGLE